MTCRCALVCIGCVRMCVCRCVCLSVPCYIGYTVCNKPADIRAAVSAK